MIKSLLFLLSICPQYVGNKYYITEYLYKDHNKPIINNVGYNLNNCVYPFKKVVWVDFTTESTLTESNYHNFMNDGFLHTIEIEMPPLIYTTYHDKISWRYHINLDNWTTDLEMNAWETTISIEAYNE